MNRLLLEGFVGAATGLLCNPTAHQWSLDFATPNVGTLGIPCVGEFENGRGDFYDQETINGKTIAFAHKR
jgi:hypothetical protein